MTTQQIHFGEARVWSFEATANITSGQVVYIDDGGRVRPTSAASQHVFGVALIPASVGRQCSIIMEGVVRVLTSGVGDVVGGDLFGGGADGKAVERTSAQENERRLDLGFAVEASSRNTRAMIKLCW